MNYEGFKQYVADHIKEFLPQDYSVHEIGITKQRKNNDVVLDALSIKGDSNIVPVIYLEPYYQAYTDGVCCSISFIGYSAFCVWEPAA